MDFVVKNLKLIEKAQAKPPYQLMLTDEKSLWGSELAPNAPRPTEKTTLFYLPK